MKWTRESIIILVISLSSLVLFLKAYSYHDEILRLNRDIIAIEEKLEVKAGNYTHYLEKRMNSLAQRQDEYQYSTSQRIKILEERISNLKSNNSNKIINNNNISVNQPNSP